MIENFNLRAVRTVEFGVCVEPENQESVVLVPASSDIKGALEEMLGFTVAQWEQIDAEWRDFEIAEKYASTERLRAPLDAEELARLREMYSWTNLPPRSDALAAPGEVIYYFAQFYDDLGRKLVGVRRATQFKGLVKARNRLVQMMNDTLKLVEAEIFRLDVDFDFLLTSTHAYILRPSGLEFIADVGAYTTERASEKALALAHRLTFVDFSPIAQYAATHKRAARLVASISVRADLEKVDRDRLVLQAKRTGVQVQEVNGLVSPAQGSELAFLELLDYRRYEVDLIPDEPNAFVAEARRRVR